MGEGHPADDRPVADGVAHFGQRRGDVLTYAAILVARRDESLAVAAAHAEPDAADRVVVGNGEGATTRPLLTTAVPEEQQPVLKRSRQRRLDPILPGSRYHHLQDSPRIHSGSAHLGAALRHSAPAIAEEIEDLRQVPRRVIDGAHAVRGDD